jgi:hypothetical protein
MVTDLVPGKWLQILFRENGYGKYSRKMFTDPVPGKWLRQIFQENVYRSCSRKMVTDLVPGKWLRQIFQENNLNKCSRKTAMYKLLLQENANETCSKRCSKIWSIGKRSQSIFYEKWFLFQRGNL